MPLDIFIVFILNAGDGTRTPYWIDAENKAAARRKARKIAGKIGKIVEVSYLGELVIAGAKKPRAKKSPPPKR